MLYGPSGFQHMGGAPAEQELYKPLRDEEEAERVWLASEKLAGVTFPARPRTSPAELRPTQTAPPEPGHPAPG